MTALTVSELIEILRQAPQERQVLFLDSYADLDEADEVSQVDIQNTTWTHESGRAGREKYACHYPGQRETRDEQHSDVVQIVESVIVLSSGPTNLRFYKEDY